VRLLGPLDTEDRRGVVSFSVGGFSAEDACRRLDGRGVALRGGHHCVQPILGAFGLEGAARASLAPYTVHADITVLLDGIDELVSTKASRLAPQNGMWGGQKACSGT
jgi:cysteine desulfurase/selenocysteine lyase